MTDENPLPQSELAGAVEPAQTAAETAEPPASTVRVTENSPLGAFRQARLKPALGEASYKPIPSLPPHSTSQPERNGNPQATVDAPKFAVSHREEDEQDSNPNSSDATDRDALGNAVPVASPQEEPRPQEPVPAMRASVAPVEIPPPVKQLDAEMEAEIEAAMASGDLDPNAAHVTSAGEEDHPHEEKPAEELLEPGQHLTGRIQSIHADNVFLDLGYRATGLVSLRQFVSGKKPEVGQRIEVLVDRISPEEGLIHLSLPKGLRRIAGNWDSLAKGQIVDCIVNRTNKGGLEVTVSGLRAFLPASQVELGFISDLNPYIGQKLRVEVMEVNARKKNLVVSRRAYLQIERAEAEEAFWQTLEVDQVYTGKVKTIKDYGAFIDLGSVDGFLHIGEMSWYRIKHPSEVVKEGQTVDVKIVSLDREKKKISLGMKQLVQNPWSTAAEKYPANSTVTGKVTRIADFGAFVELEPGLEGLVHVSEIDHKHVRHPSAVLKVHQVVTAQVLEVDVERKRVSLSLKALLARPEEPKPAEEPAAEPIQRKRKGALKGGTGSSAPGGMFGNPSDFK